MDILDQAKQLININNQLEPTGTPTINLLKPMGEANT